MDPVVISSRFIFDNELLVNDDRQSINGYLWAIDYLVDKLPSTREMENINFYADYNVLTGEVKLWSSFYVPDDQAKPGEKNVVVNIELTAPEKAEVLDVLQSYCCKKYLQSCLEFVNEMRAHECLPLINSSLDEKIIKASLIQNDSFEESIDILVQNVR